MSAPAGHNAPGVESAVRVLVVDDSAFMRYVVSKELSADPSIKVVGMARDGLDALQKVGELKPDVVTMDLEMPRMDGLTALGRLMSEDPVPVVLLSSLTQEGAAVTIHGLELGAADFVTKPSTVQAASSVETWQTLLAKVKAAARLDVRRLRSRSIQAPHMTPRTPVQPVVHREQPKKPEKLVVVGTSTGGPRALFDVIPRLPNSLDAAVVVVQHMPPGFTRSLASRLNDVSPLEVKEAEDGDQITLGRALLAPGDFHMVVKRGGRIGLERSPSIHGVRPAVDVTMESAASVFGARTVAVVLTGMGRDGTAGALSIRRVGGVVLAEDEATCVVYGMPRSAYEAGAVNRVVRLEHVADAIVQAVSTLPREAGEVVS
ncbi:MAG: chemotaxis response regulator protein-glutamate methylesterase [Actinobacteria bacterium]|nr:chemotaxis response regulator protein-glutamate methylesterase [Actinomycetota bacterium]